jgi:hypothetical protein
MEFQFEEFTAKKGRFTPVITLIRGGLGISSGFSRRYGIQKYVGVKLYWDKVNQVIGVRFVEKEENGMFKLKIRTDGGALLPAKSFFESYAINVNDFDSRYIPEIVQDARFGELFVLNLKKKSE